MATNWPTAMKRNNTICAMNGSAYGGGLELGAGVGDLSGDGNDDIVTTGSDGVVRVYYTPPTGGDVASSTATCWVTTPP